MEGLVKLAYDNKQDDLIERYKNLPKKDDLIERHENLQKEKWDLYDQLPEEEMDYRNKVLTRNVGVGGGLGVLGGVGLSSLAGKSKVLGGGLGGLVGGAHGLGLAAAQSYEHLKENHPEHHEKMEAIKKQINEAEIDLKLHEKMKGEYS